VFRAEEYDDSSGKHAALNGFAKQNYFFDVTQMQVTIAIDNLLQCLAFPSLDG